MFLGTRSPVTLALHALSLICKAQTALTQSNREAGDKPTSVGRNGDINMFSIARSPTVSKIQRTADLSKLRVQKELCNLAVRRLNARHATIVCGVVR